MSYIIFRQNPHVFKLQNRIKNILTRHIASQKIQNRRPHPTSTTIFPVSSHSFCLPPLYHNHYVLYIKNNHLKSQRSAPQPATTPAEGETVPTIVVVWRVDIGYAELQVVSVRRRSRSTRPIPAPLADVVNSAVVNIHVPATDKSQKQTQVKKPFYS